MISAKHLPRLMRAPAPLWMLEILVSFLTIIFISTHILQVLVNHLFIISLTSAIKESTCHRTVLKYLFMHLCLQNWIIAMLYSMAYRTTKLKSYSTSRMPLLVSSLFQENMKSTHYTYFVKSSLAENSTLHVQVF